jgi:hypothetical protein
MATAITSTPASVTDSAPVSRFRTVADLLEHLGGVSPARVRFQPWPGTATVRDVIAVHDAENRLCELVDGVLVEKAMGFDESIYLDPKRRTVRVYTGRDRSVLIHEDRSLDGGEVLPGFSLSIRDWFAEARRCAAR